MVKERCEKWLVSRCLRGKTRCKDFRFQDLAVGTEWLSLCQKFSLKDLVRQAVGPRGGWGAGGGSKGRLDGTFRTTCCATRHNMPAVHIASLSCAVCKGSAVQFNSVHLQHPV